MKCTFEYHCNLGTCALAHVWLFIEKRDVSGRSLQFGGLVSGRRRSIFLIPPTSRDKHGCPSNKNRRKTKLIHIGRSTVKQDRRRKNMLRYCPCLFALFCISANTASPVNRNTKDHPAECFQVPTKRSLAGPSTTSAGKAFPEPRQCPHASIFQPLFRPYPCLHGCDNFLARRKEGHIEKFLENP